MNKEALIVIDYINEMVSPEGKIAKGRGYPTFLTERDVIPTLNQLIEEYATSGSLIVFVSLAFKKDWVDQPKQSKIFGKAHEFEVLQEGTWSTQIIDDVVIPDGAVQLRKTRVSAFYNTPLESLLRNCGITTVSIAGVATDLAVEAAARDAHDRDFLVKIHSRACGAATIDDHERSLMTMSKFAEIIE